MSYAILRRALTGMRAAGEEGFEGLAASLLERLTGDRFFVARSGSQPADAVSRGGIAMQAKRYDETRFDENGFEGEFSRACRLIDGLDVYVFAATCAHAQLEVLSRQLEQREGVDIFLLGFDGERSPLAALCVTFWDVVRRFLPANQSLPAQLDAWAAHEAARPEVQTQVARLRADFLHLVHTAESTRRRLGAFLDGRFGFNPAGARPARFAIDLPRAVARRDPMDALNAWWREGSRPAAVLTGEEGMGKSWVAAAFAREVARADATMVLWLDSADWAGSRSLREVVETGLRLAGIGDERLVGRLAGKALRQWRRQLLIVLDGVNERGAREAAHHLLAELLSSAEASARVLFTSRPTAWRADERALWGQVSPMRVDGFSEEEFCAALRGLPTPIERAEVPAGLAEIARIPRYFHRAVKLRESFRSLVNVSKEMVLWADLLEKIAANDPQVAGRLAWTSEADARRALLALAQNAGQLRDADPEDRGYRMLLRVFGNDFTAVRHDLAEQRIVLDPAGEHPRPNAAHVRLGFALHIGRFLRRCGGDGVEELADALRRELEPLASQDDLTEALFVALQLSALPRAGEGVAALSTRQRAALLLAWSMAHNARTEPARLHFWMEEDQAAYLDFLEAAFAQSVSEPWMRDLLGPVAEAWRRAPDPVSRLAQRLRRWLKLVWFDPLPPASTGLVSNGFEFPFAQTKDQLALSRIALAVFSETPPLDALLLDFVLAWATDRICVEDHFSPEREGQSAQRFSVQCKNLLRNLAPYFRWKYTERVEPSLRELKNVHSGNDLLAKACDGILEAFDMFGWGRQASAETELLAGGSLFLDTPQGMHSRFSDCAHLAVREDLRPLSPGDLASIAQIVEQAFASPDFKAGRHMTGTDVEANSYLAWFARHYPQRLLELGSQFRLTALNRGEWFGALEFANRLPYSPQLVPPRKLSDAMKRFAARVLAGPVQGHYWELTECHVLALTCFAEEELSEWFEFAAEHLPLRREFHVAPITNLLPWLCPRRIANAAIQRAVDLAAVPGNPSKHPESEFEFWADITGRNCDRDSAANLKIAVQLETCPRGNWRRFHLLMVYFRTLSDEARDQAFTTGELLRHLDWEGWQALRLSGRSSLPWTKLPQNFNYVLEQVGLNIAGSLFAHAGQVQNLQRWGELLFAKASQLLNATPPAREFWGRTIQITDAEGLMVAMTCDGTHGPAVEAPRPLRPTRNASASAFSSSEQVWRERETSTNRAIQLWLEDVRRLETFPPGILHHFPSTPALASFRDRDPDRFRRLAMTLLEQVRADPGEAFHLNGFVHAVASVLMPLDPDYAMALAIELREGPFRSDVVNEYGVSTSMAACWASAQMRNTRCVELCHAMLHGAASDMELMNHAITAQAESAGPLLFSMCEEWLESDFARERCLAVSLLPWMDGPTITVRLSGLAQNEPSGWVRSHAEWAAGVARQESAVREHYRRVLMQEDVALAKTMLEVMRPALTPTAVRWRAAIELETESKSQRSDRRDVPAAISLFWDGVNSIKGSAPEYYGRKLGDYLRGERISDMTSPPPRLA